MIRRMLRHRHNFSMLSRDISLASCPNSTGGGSPAIKSADLATMKIFGNIMRPREYPIVSVFPSYIRYLCMLPFLVSVTCATAWANGLDLCKTDGKNHDSLCCLFCFLQTHKITSFKPAEQSMVQMELRLPRQNSNFLDLIIGYRPAHMNHRLLAGYGSFPSTWKLSWNFSSPLTNKQGF